MRKKKQMTPALFQKMLERLIEMLVLAKAHVEIGRGLGQALQDDPAIAHVAPAFWGMSITAHLDVAQLYAFKFFDTHPGAMTIEHLLKMAEHLKGSFSNGTPAQVEAVVKGARIRIARLRARQLKQISQKRNRVLAHADQMIVTNPEKLSEAIKLTLFDLHFVFKEAGDILNDISVTLRDLSPLYELVGTNDYRTVLDLVAEAKCTQIRQYEAEFGRWEHDYMRPKRCRES